MYCVNRMNTSLIFDLGMMLEVALLEFGVNLRAISALLKGNRKKREKGSVLAQAVLTQDCSFSMQMIDSGAARRERRDQTLGSVR